MHIQETMVAAAIDTTAHAITAEHLPSCGWGHRLGGAGAAVGRGRLNRLGRLGRLSRLGPHMGAAGPVAVHAPEPLAVAGHPLGVGRLDREALPAGVDAQSWHASQRVTATW